MAKNELVLMMLPTSAKLFTLAVAAVTFGQNVGLELPLCAYSSQAGLLEHAEDGVWDLQGTIIPSGDRMLCRIPSLYCFSLWQEEKVDNVSVVNMLAQGCWEDATGCEQTSCVAHRQHRELNNTKFCCCRGNLCNVNTTYIPRDDPRDIPAEQAQQLERYDHSGRTLVMTVALVSAALVVGVVLIILAKVWSGNRKTPHKHAYLPEAPPITPTFDLADLKLVDVIGRGRYGSVWKGMLYDQEVAIKMFPTYHRQYFINEKDIYCLPHMDHPCLLRYFGAEERMGLENRLEYMLVLSLAPHGCLHEFLHANTVDWLTLCRMALSITRGLAHLHTDVKKHDKYKPVVSHRDVGSRNVLVKADLSCCLCDLGFAMKIAGSKYYYNGEEQNAETTSLTDVGTLRYMAPEVLEGAVNLRDCESALKQVDMYALGLVLWEVAARCSDLYQGMEVPSYLMPFEAEIGIHPTFEQVQVMVSRNRARPLFPDVWKDSNPAVRQLKETIEDCWDQDAEARLTALCVEERLGELPILWERYKGMMMVSGPSPTFTSMPAYFPDDSAVDLHDNHVRAPVVLRDCGDSSVSEATVETMVTLSPDVPDLICKNNLVSVVRQPLPPLQPHQGRNPCMERNLMVAPVQEEQVTERSWKHSRREDLGVDLLDALHHVDDHEGRALITTPTPPAPTNHTTNAAITHQRTNNPIPMVQNPVREGHIGGQPTFPKQSNVSVRGPSLLGRLLALVSNRQNYDHHLPMENVRNQKQCNDARSTEVRLINGDAVVEVTSGSSDDIMMGKENNRLQRPTSLHLPEAEKREDRSPPRVRTPYKLKGRLSLYDDRIMTSEPLLGTPPAPTTLEARSVPTLDPKN